MLPEDGYQPPKADVKAVPELEFAQAMQKGPGRSTATRALLGSTGHLGRPAFFPNITDIQRLQ
jgi:hypothetical protein